MVALKQQKRMAKGHYAVHSTITLQTHFLDSSINASIFLSKFKQVKASSMQTYILLVSLYSIRACGHQVEISLP
jgi:hypothetical protein